MHAPASIRLSRRLTLALPALLLAGCFGTGEGPTPIAGTPAPPPPPLPPGFCDPINFEDECGAVGFADFAGGLTQIVSNPVSAGINTSAKVARHQKFFDQPFGGTTLQPADPIVFFRGDDAAKLSRAVAEKLDNGEAFKMKVLANREVPVLFKLEGLDREQELTYTGGGAWQELCFDFTDDTEGDPVTGITLIFDNGTQGDAANDPDAWTFHFDDIEQVATCAGDALNVDFEDDPASYDFGPAGGFGGGASSVIANPDPSGINESAQVARMQKFPPEPFGGSTLSLGNNVDFSLGDAFQMKVWSAREVPVLFKFEGLDQEVTETHPGGGMWEQLCFDFTGRTVGPDSNAITFIFDNGVVGDAENDPNNWTFYFDDIEQVASCDGDPGPGDGEWSTITFDDPAVSYALRGFGGAEDSTIQADPTGAANMVVQVNRADAAETFAGTVVSTGPNESLPRIPLDATTTQMSVRVFAPAAGIPVRLKIENADDAGISVETEATTTVANAFETLTFDFTSQADGTAAFDPNATYNRVIVFFNFGTDGATAGAQTYYFDDVAVVEGDDGGGGDTFTRITFDDPAVSYALRGFGGAEDSTIQPDPTNAANNVVQVNRADAAETFAGTVVSTGPNESLPRIPLDATNTQMSVLVNSPVAGIPVRLKIENSADAGISVETEAMTTVANAFETLTFDFTNQAGGTAAFDPNATYDRVIIFFNFGASGADAGAQTFFFDDIDVVTDDGGEGPGDGGPPGMIGDASFDFEGDPAQYDFGPDGGFGGGASTVIANPDPSGINTTAQVVQMQKFAAEVFGGSTLAVPEGVDFSQGEAFRMKVWSPRVVPVLFKFEGLNQERTQSHDGGGTWQQLCFDFRNSTDGPAVTGITVIFDLGVLGDAENDPDNWTFYYDEIEQVTECGPPAAFPIDFEDDPTSYDFGPDAGFGGGATTVIANPDPSGINLSAQVAQMQKFPAEVFGGSSLSLGGSVDFTAGEAFKMKVWATRPVPVLFKFEGLNQERTLSHSGSGTWEELCFDFTGSTAGPASDTITFIFDNGVLGDATNDPANWTFYFDDIEQSVDCGIPPAEFPIDFEDDPTSYDFGPDAGFAGGASVVIANPDQSGLNTTAQTARMQKFGGDVFGGSTLSLGGNVPFADGEVFKMKVWATRPVPVLFKFEGLNAESTVSHSGSGTWEELCFDFTGMTAGPVSNAITFIFDNGVLGDADNDPDNWTFYFDEIEQTTTCADEGGGGDDMFSTITFDDPAVTYALRGFGGAEDSVLAADPDDAANTVVQVNRSAAAETFAGTVVSTGENESIPVIPLDAMNTQMTLRVRSPAAGIVARMKIENAGDPGISVETEATTTVADSWETLTFNFLNQADGTAAFNPDATYNKVVIFLNFGTTGADAGAQTFYFDDIDVAAGDGGDGGDGGGGGTDTIDFESGMATFGDFEGGVATVIANPDPSGINVSAQVGQMQKFAGAPFGGSTLDLGGAVALADGDSYLMKVRALREVVVTFKLEPLGVERTATHSGSGMWEELCFDFTGVAGDVTGITLIFDNGTVGDAQNDPDNWTFQFDDIAQSSSVCPTDEPGDTPAFSAITFDDPDVTYTLTDFGGNASAVTNDPDGGSNMVGLVVRSDAAETFAGTTVSTLEGDAIPRLPLDAMNTQMTVRVFAPAAGIVVRLKIEDATNAGISVETEATTTVANAWETLTFDFANEAPGTAAFNPASDYTRVTIFFNFGTTGADAGEQTYYFDDIDVATGDGGDGGDVGTFPTITFDDPAVTYALRGFGGAEDSLLTMDPLDGANTVVQVNRSAAAEVFAGTVVSTGENESIPVIPLDAMNTQMSVRVNSPAAGIPVRLKIENSADGGISVETEATTTVGNAWETLTFNFLNQVDGTAAFNPAATYDKVVVFFNFGATGADAGAQTFFFDDIDIAPGDGGGDGGDGGDGGGGGDVGPGDELVVNGDFETGDLTGWTIFDNGGLIMVDGTENNGGMFSVNVVAGQGQNPVLKQESLAVGSVMPGDLINVSFDMKGSAVDGGVIFPELISEQADGSSGELLDTIAAPTPDWTTYTYMATAGADVTRGITLQIAVVCGGAPTCSAAVFIDNASVVIAP